MKNRWLGAHHLNKQLCHYKYTVNHWIVPEDACNKINSLLTLVFFKLHNLKHTLPYNKLGGKKGGGNPSGTFATKLSYLKKAICGMILLNCKLNNDKIPIQLMVPYWSVLCSILKTNPLCKISS